MTTVNIETNASILTEHDETAWEITIALGWNTARVATAVEVACADDYLADLQDCFTMSLKALAEVEYCHPAVAWHFANEINKTAELLLEIGALGSEARDHFPLDSAYTPAPDETDMCWLMLKHLLDLDYRATEVHLAADYDRASDYSDALIDAYLEAFGRLNGQAMPVGYVPLGLEFLRVFERAESSLNKAGFEVR